MPITYDLAGPEVSALIVAVMGKHHPDLETEDVTVQVLMASDINEDEELAPALKVHGRPAAAKISVTSLVDRVRGIPDAKLVIDRFEWSRMTMGRRAALLDHELTHLQLVIGKDGFVKRDDRNRPKLRLRHHDWELTGFQKVVERHGEASVEAHNFAQFQTAYGQLLLFPPSPSVKAVSDVLNGAQIMEVPSDEP